MEIKIQNSHDIAVLLLRVALGLVFIVAGWNKRVGIENVVGFFGQIGLAPFIAYIVAYGEFIGGILMLVGVGTRWVAVFLALVMVGAIGKVNLANGFMSSGPGYAFDLVLFLVAVAVALTGAGKYSVSRLLGKKCGDCGTCTEC